MYLRSEMGERWRERGQTFWILGQHCHLISQYCLKGSYDVAKKNIILFCIWSNAMCLCGLRFKKLLLLLYFLSETLQIFTKLIVLRSEACSDWPAIQCVVIGQILQACDGNVTPLTVLWCRVPARWHKNNKTHYKQGICCIQWGHNYWLLWLIWSCCAVPRKHNIMSAFVIVEMPNKHYSTLFKTRVWIVSIVNMKTYLQAVGQKHQLELPHFIETAFVHNWHCRLLSQVQEIVLR